MSNFNAIDGIVLLIFGFSILIGFVRGFLKEAISLASWIAAAYIASTFASPVAAHFTGGGTLSMMAVAVAFIALFVGTLIVGSIVGYIFTSAGTISGLGFINRILGAAFGFARGYVVVIIAMFLAQMTPIVGQDSWRGSQFVNDFQPTVKEFSDAVEPQLQSLKAMGTSAVQGVAGQAGSSFSGAISSFTGAASSAASGSK